MFEHLCGDSSESAIYSVKLYVGEIIFQVTSYTTKLELFENKAGDNVESGVYQLLWKNPVEKPPFT